MPKAIPWQGDERCPTCKGSKWMCPECGKAKPDCEASDCGVVAVSADGCPEGCAQPARYTVGEVDRWLDARFALYRCPHHGLIDGGHYSREQEWGPEDGCPLLCADEEECGEEVERVALSAAFPDQPTDTASQHDAPSVSDQSRPDGPGEAIKFIQRVASQRNAICKSDHHAATCSGAVGLAEEAAQLLSGMGIEPRFPRREWQKPCWICGNGDYVLGQVWIDGAHAECREAVAGTTVAPHLAAPDQQQHSTEERDRWQKLKAALFSDEACRAGAAVLAGEGGVSDGDVVEVRHEIQAAWDVATGHAFSLPPDAPSSTEEERG